MSVVGHMALGQKLDPRRFTAMSPKMAAIVACILDDQATFRTQPVIVELCITSDGGLLARHAGDIGFNDFIGSADDLERNLTQLEIAAELTPDEIDQFDALVRTRVSDWRNGPDAAIGHFDLPTDDQDPNAYAPKEN
jgi:hypothetical protein